VRIGPSLLFFPLAFSYVWPWASTSKEVADVPPSGDAEEQRLSSKALLTRRRLVRPFGRLMSGRQAGLGGHGILRAPRTAPCIGVIGVVRPSVKAVEPELLTSSTISARRVWRGTWSLKIFPKRQFRNGTFGRGEARCCFPLPPDVFPTTHLSVSSDMVLLVGSKGGAFSCPSKSGVRWFGRQCIPLMCFHRKKCHGF